MADRNGITRREFVSIACASLPLLSARPAIADGTDYKVDVCVYGGTASGVMAAVAASREGSRVLIVEPSRWLGGMTGGGISTIDWGRRAAVGGSTITILEKEYDNAQYRRVFGEMVAANHIEVVFEHRLVRVVKEQRSIAQVVLGYAPPDATGCPCVEVQPDRTCTVRAGVFIDCTYEGDLMAAAGVSYAFGRESTAQYGESLAGVRPNLWTYDIDPYNTPGDPSSGLLPLLQDLSIGPLGSADRLTMGYAFRYKFDLTGSGFPITPADNYDPGQFEMYRRGFSKGIDLLRSRKMSILGEIEERDGKLYRPGTGNMNRSLLTTTVFGSNAGYPDGDWVTRAGIWRFQQDFFRNLTHFLRTDPSVPTDLQDLAKQASFERGVFDDTSGWPHQLYIREARRMVSSYVLTQQDLEGKTSPVHGVGLASYGVDDWPYATIADGGKIALSGGEFSILYLDEAYQGIYVIPYEAIVPRNEECENLIVPVCCSASHIAMTSIRMEPVWMILGESAGVAAALVSRDGLAVQALPYDQLRARLDSLGQLVERPDSAA